MSILENKIEHLEKRVARAEMKARIICVIACSVLAVGIYANSNLSNANNSSEPLSQARTVQAPFVIAGANGKPILKVDSEGSNHLILYSPEGETRIEMTAFSLVPKSAASGEGPSRIALFGRKHQTVLISSQDSAEGSYGLIRVNDKNGNTVASLEPK